MLLNLGLGCYCREWQLKLNSVKAQSLLKKKILLNEKKKILDLLQMHHTVLISVCEMKFHHLKVCAKLLSVHYQSVHTRPLTTRMCAPGLDHGVAP